jgi:hypothetical protein
MNPRTDTSNTSLEFDTDDDTVSMYPLPGPCVLYVSGHPYASFDSRDHAENFAWKMMFACYEIRGGGLTIA